MREKASKVILDPIYGHILLTENEIRIVDTPYFQRLRNIKQLGLTSLVYPSASHTRFEHSLGTLHVASKMLDHLEEVHERVPLDEKKRSIVRLAALLHDIGHGPFGHSFDRIWDQEKWTARIIQDTEIRDIVDDMGVRPSDVIFTILGDERKDPSLHQFINGALDADQFDYLIRDSFFAGLATSTKRVEEVIRNITYVGGFQRLVFLEKALGEIEDLLINRYRIYNELYFNRTVRIAELLASRIFDLLISYGEISIPEELSNLVRFDDTFCEWIIRRVADKPRSAILKKLLSYLVNRRFPKVVWESASEQEPSLDGMARRLKINESLLFLDILRFPSIEGIYISSDATARITSVGNLSALLTTIEARGRILSRAYVPSENTQQAAKILRELASREGSELI